MRIYINNLLAVSITILSLHLLLITLIEDNFVVLRVVYKLKPLVHCSRVARMKWTDNVRHVWKFCYILCQSFALALFSAGFSFLNVGLCGNQNSLLEFIMYFIIVFPWGLTHGLRFFRKLFSHQYVLASFAGSWHLVDFDSVVVFFFSSSMLVCASVLSYALPHFSQI